MKVDPTEDEALEIKPPMRLERPFTSSVEEAFSAPETESVEAMELEADDI